jgi:hypothetical protein
MVGAGWSGKVDHQLLAAFVVVAGLVVSLALVRGARAKRTEEPAMPPSQPAAQEQSAPAPATSPAH